MPVVEPASPHFHLLAEEEQFDPSGGVPGQTCHGLIEQNLNVNGKVPSHFTLLSL
jgi:hypothetical protein